MSLEQLQHDFIHAMYSSTRSKADELTRTQRRMSSQHALDPHAQVAVYRASVQGGLIAALGDIYPRVKTMLGEQFFDALARAFVQEHPSFSASLDDYGEVFPDFCAEFSPLQDFPYMADLARVDWAWHRAFHGADLAPLSGAALEALPQRALLDTELVLHPFAYAIHSSHAIHALWSFAESSYRATTQGADQDQTTELNLDHVQAESLLVCREAYQVQVVRLDEAAKALIEQFAQAQRIETAFAKASHAVQHIEHGADLSSAFSLLLRCGAFVRPQAD